MNTGDADSQPDLFGAPEPAPAAAPPATPPRTHAGDPATSHRAEARMRETGTMGRHARTVLEAVRREPGMTSSELADLTGMQLYAVRRRLSDLKAAGLVGSIAVPGGRESAWFAKGGGVS